jgi:hypothetical protein
MISQFGWLKGMDLVPQAFAMICVAIFSFKQGKELINGQPFGFPIAKHF